MFVKDQRSNQIGKTFIFKPMIKIVADFQLLNQNQFYKIRLITNSVLEES